MMTVQFVTRPIQIQRYGGVLKAIRQTARNGKAIRLKRQLTVEYRLLSKEGLRVHQMKRGPYQYVWATRTNGGKGR